MFQASSYSAEKRTFQWMLPETHKGLKPDSFPVPTYLFFKGNERLGRNDVKVAGQAGKGERKVAPRFLCGLP